MFLLVRITITAAYHRVHIAGVCWEFCVHIILVDIVTLFYVLCVYEIGVYYCPRLSFAQYYYHISTFVATWLFRQLLCPMWLT